MGSVSRVIVEIDVYSGRPNPTWVLRHKESVWILRQIRRLPSVDASTSVPGLGFRGFVLHVQSAKREEVFRVHDCIIQTGEKLCIDRDGTIERKLLAAIPSDLKTELSDVLPAREY